MRVSGVVWAGYKKGPSPSCRAQKDFGSEIGRSAPTLVTGKAENVDQSDSSIPIESTSEDTPALVKDSLHLTILPHP
jgi:hypothetical protein